MGIMTTDKLDPAGVTDDASLKAFLAAATEEIRSLKGDNATMQRASDDMAKKYREAMEQVESARRNIVRSPVGDDRDVVGRYRSGDKIALTTRTEKIDVGNGRAVSVDLPGLLDDREVMTEWQRDLQSAVGQRAMLRLCLAPGVATPNADAAVVRAASRAPVAVRDAIFRAFADSSGAGAEWIPDVFSPELFMAFEIPSVFADAFPTTDLTGPTIKPKITGQPRLYLLGADSTSDQPAILQATQVTTSNQTLAPPTLGMRAVIGMASAEDAALPVVSIVQQMLVKAHADGYEDAMVNGDTAGTHQDAIATWNIRSRWGSSGLGGSNDHRRAFMGFRALAYDRSATVDQSGGQTVAKVLEELVGGLGEYAAGNVLLATSPEVYFKKFATDSNVLTVDKFGPSASILRGAPASLGGRPILLSRFISADLATTGLYTGSGATSGVLAINRESFAHYRRRGPSVDITRTANTQTIEIVATQRKGMDTLTGSSDKVCFWGFRWL